MKKKALKPVHITSWKASQHPNQSKSNTLLNTLQVILWSTYNALLLHGGVNVHNYSTIY